MANEVTTFRSGTPIQIGKSNLIIKQVLGSGSQAVVYLIGPKGSPSNEAIKLGCQPDDAALDMVDSAGVRNAIIPGESEFVNIDHKQYIGQRQKYVNGENLINYARGKPLDSARTANFMGQLACTIRDCEKAHVVHGDIKPANLLTDSTGKLSLVDWDIARPAGTKNTGSGTMAFMAPEMLSGQPRTAKQDVFAAGMTMAQLLTARPPRDGTLKADDDDMSRRRKVAGYQGCPQVDNRLMQRIIAQATHRDVHERSSPLEFQANLAAYPEARKHYQAEEIGELVEHVCNRSKLPVRKDVMVDANAARGLLEELTPQHPRFRELSAIANMYPDLRQVTRAEKPRQKPDIYPEAALHTEGIRVSIAR